MDLGGKNQLSSLDILAFFKANGEIIAESEAFLLVASSDSNNDGRLSFAE